MRPLPTQHCAAMPAAAAQARLVVHLLTRLDAGAGNGLLNLITHMPAERYRHAIVCLHDDGGYDAHLRERGVRIVSLHKRAGADPGHYLRLYRALRALRPDLVHTRGLGGLEGQLVAALAGVRLRVHAEHGGEHLGRYAARLRQRLPRRMLRPLIGHFIAASAELERWLVEQVGAEPARVSQISNGVDSVQFHPRLGPPAAVGPPGFMHDNTNVIGSAGRMDAERGHTALVEAFLRLIASPHPAHQRLRLLIVGDGPLRAECRSMLERAGAGHRAWLPGERADIAQLMRSMDLFVLPALPEGGSAAILEAMATGLPVVASAAGASTELVHPGFTGILVPPGSPDVMAAAIADYCRIPEMGIRHGARARSQVIAHHSLPAMARSYLAVYDSLAPDAAPVARRG